MATISVPSMDASCWAWPVPRAPTPMRAMRILSSFGATKSPMYFAPPCGTGPSLSATAGRVVSAAVRPPRALRKPRRSVTFGLSELM